MRSSFSLPIWVSFLLFSAINFLPLSASLFAANNVTYYGDAHLRLDAISLTQEHKCSPPSSFSSFPTSFPSTGVGRAIYVYPIQFIDPATNAPASFSCRFTFTIIQSPGCPFGDGMAFFITSNAESSSFSDGYIGLPGPALNPQDSFIAVEFDTHLDSSFSDINDNHIGIDVSTIVSFASVDAMSIGLDLRSRREITAWIEYIDVAKLVRVWASYSQTKPKIPILEARVDLSEHFKEFMNVGFTAGNGQGSAVHVVNHWQFRTYWSPPSVNPREEENCFMCPLQDSDETENPNLRFQERRAKIREIALGFGGITAFLVSIAAIVVIVFFLTKKKNCIKRICKGDGSGPTRLSIAEIKAATFGFHRSRIIGKGASATVYKGFLPSIGAVAIKRFNKAQIDSCRNPFITEFATIVGCLKHNNLVQLQGWCCEKAELVLVYEFLPNGTLDKNLHDANSSSSTSLSWKQRSNIVLGVASALSYLHEKCERQIIHRDVKTCNIMLDEEYNAKVGDFGLAEVYEHSTATREATIPAGTMGYLAPEYVYSGIPSVKTDVYSFGMVVLEVATGRRPVDENETVLVDWVWNFWEQGKLIKAADSKLKGKFNGVEMERMLLVGLSCVHPNHLERPTMKEAAKILKGKAPLPILPARKPKVGFQHALPKDYSQESTAAAATVGGDSNSSTEELIWSTPRSHF